MIRVGGIGDRGRRYRSCGYSDGCRDNDGSRGGCSDRSTSWVGRRWPRGSRRSCGCRCPLTDTIGGLFSVIIFAIRIPDSSAKGAKDDGQDNDEQDPEVFFPRVAEVLNKSAAVSRWTHLVLAVAQIDRCGFYKGDVVVA